MSAPLLRPLLRARAPAAPRLVPRLVPRPGVLPQRALSTSAPVEPAPRSPPPPQRRQQQQQQPGPTPRRKSTFLLLEEQRQPPPPPPPRHPNNAPNPTAGHVRPLAFKSSHPAAPPEPVENSVERLLPLLAAQPGHYITVHIHGFPYLVQEGDQVRLPFLMPKVLPGDVLRLDRASVLGSRDYTLKGAPFIDPRLFQCRATVLGVESEPLRIKIKTKRRQRKQKRVKSKHRYTTLRISELHVEASTQVKGRQENGTHREREALQQKESS